MCVTWGRNSPVLFKNLLLGGLQPWCSSFPRLTLSFPINTPQLCVAFPLVWIFWESEGDLKGKRVTHRLCANTIPSCVRSSVGFTQRPSYRSLLESAPRFCMLYKQWQWHSSTILSCKNQVYPIPTCMTWRRHKHVLLKPLRHGECDHKITAFPDPHFT